MDKSIHLREENLYKNQDEVAIKAFQLPDNTHALCIRETPDPLPIANVYHMTYELEKSTIADVETPLISIRNTSTTISMRVGTLGLTTRGNKDVAIILHYGGTVIGGTWESYANGSIGEFNNTLTSFTIDPLIEVEYGLVMKENDQMRLNLFKGDVIVKIPPQSQITMTALSKNINEVSYFIRTIEEFMI